MKKPPLHDVIVMKNEDHLQTTHQQRRPSASGAATTTAGIRKRHVAPSQHTTQERAHVPQTEPDDFGMGPIDEQPRTNKRWLIIALSVGAIVVVVATLLSVLFAGATVTVYPKQDTVVADAAFTVREEATPGELSFKRMTIEREAVKEVIALEEEEVEERAQGTITIFNEYSETPQRLITRTRFQSADGKIFRTREAVEVPGKGRDGSPGSIEIIVVAEEPGEEYNIQAGEFSIPGFVGYPQEGLLYARSTDAFGGGFVGIKRTVDEGERLAAQNSLESQLRDELLAELAQSPDKPQGYLSFGEAVFFEFNTLPDAVAETEKVRLSLRGKLHAVLFNEDELARNLASRTMGSYENSPIRIDNIEELTVTLDDTQGTGEADVPWTASSYNITVAGKTKFIWEFDEVQFAKDLAGKDKAVLETSADTGIRSAYPGIDRVRPAIRPFWKGTFPDDANAITVITELDE